MPGLYEILDMVDNIHHLGGFDGSWIEEDYKLQRGALKEMKIIFFIAVPLTALLCFGILYLRFIVFGG